MTFSGSSHNMPDADPAEIVAVSAKHEVDFLPPPDTEDEAS